MTGADPLDTAKDEFEYHCDYLAGGKVVLMQAPERFINHCCDPNTYIRTITGDRVVVALREIRPGDEFTYDYCINSDGDTAWDCTCGCPECRKRHVSGFFHLPVDVQARYLALLEDWFVGEHREEVKILKRRIEAGLRLKSPYVVPTQHVCSKGWLFLVQCFRFDVNPQFQVLPKLFPTDLEDSSTLAEMEVLQLHTLDQLSEIELSQLV